MSVSEEVYQKSTSVLGYMMRKWENRENFFHPIDGHWFLEMFHYSDDTDPDFHEGRLSENQISDWLIQVRYMKTCG